MNTIVKSIAPKSVFDDASAVTSTTADFEQGDLLIFNDTTNVIEKPTLETQGNTFLGIAQQTVIDGKVKSPYIGTAVDASQAIAPIAGPVYGVVAKLVAKTGITLAPGDLIYLDPATGARGVTNAGGTKAIGIYQGAAVASTVAGQEIECLIGCRFGGDTLKF